MKNLTILGATGFVSLIATALFSAPAVGATAGPLVVRSPNVAGYNATDPSPVTSFSGTLSVPALTCPATGNLQMLAQVSLVDPATADQADFQWSIACISGTALYSSATAYVGTYATGFGQAAIAAVAGDTLKLAMSEDSVKGTVTVKITDTSNRQTASAKVPLQASLTALSAQIDFPTGTANVTPIPTFTNVRFGDLKYNGAILSSLSPTNTEMYDGTTLQVSTSPISAAGTFSTVFKHV